MSYARPWFQNAQNLTISYLNISICISLYINILSLCKGILPRKDLHPPTEISWERKDISEKKNIKSYKSHQMTYLICHDELGNWCLENCSWES